MTALHRLADTLPPGDREVFLSDLRRVAFWVEIKPNSDRPLARMVQRQVSR